MTTVRNILFIMCDQLRADYLGCAGHPTLRTPVIDALAADGVRFSRAYCNAPVCGPSRASFYTGRYAASHGATYNNFPLRVDEHTLGDYLGALSVRTALAGKTHMRADLAGMRRLGIDPASAVGRHLLHTGFEPFERDDGLHPMQNFDLELPYNQFLRRHGYRAENPWNDFANAAEDSRGVLHSGWYLRNAHRPARVREEHAETPYMTRRAMDFIDQAGEQPWCLHLSYIKPHWPYMAPDPWHRAYQADDILPANRAAEERHQPHPVYAAFLDHEESESFSSEACRRRVIPTYMGLVSQIDHELGRLFEHLRARGRFDDTLIVFTSDHGDYLGDHWLGEKELFHEASVRIPMIIRDPSPAADTTRGQVREELIESIDLLPTFIEALGGVIEPTRLEGRSLLPLLHDSASTGDWRDAVFSEVDYAMRPARLALGLSPSRARGTMVRDPRYKYIHFPGFPPQLFDLVDDPAELRDLGRDAGHVGICETMRQRLADWHGQRRNRITVADAVIERETGLAAERGYVFGAW